MGYFENDMRYHMQKIIHMPYVSTALSRSISYLWPPLFMYNRCEVLHTSSPHTNKPMAMLPLEGSLYNIFQR